MPHQAETGPALREEIAELGEMLGRTIAELAGEESLQAVETIRRLARDRRNGVSGAGRQLEAMLAGLDENQLRVVIRAFSIFLDLANLAEDRERVRVLRQRTVKEHPRPRSESIDDALLKLHASGKSAAQVQQLLDRLDIELVFTAHPTEAKRRSVRGKLRRIRELLDEASGDRLPAERRRNKEHVRAELAKLWLTDFIRPWRPTVLQEVERGLSIKPALWDVAPRMLREIRSGLREVYPGHEFQVPPCVTFGSWIGGDRDGHPYVTAEVTEQTLHWLRRAALEFHLTACRDLFASLSLSKRQMTCAGALEVCLSGAIERWPQLASKLAEIPPNEVLRRWLAVIQWRLRQTQKVELAADLPRGAYARVEELDADVCQLDVALTAVPCHDLLVEEVSDWLDRIRTFGFHLARLDVRQDARQYRAVVDELAAKAGLCQDPSALTEKERQALLSSPCAEPWELRSEDVSEEARETLALFRLMRRVVTALGPEALGGHVVSMTHAPSDILTVLWFWRGVAQERGGARLSPLPIIPLFETIEDLRQAPPILEALLRLPAYREHLREQQDHQTIMLGYSDSTKDGGYVSACWSLYRCQQELHQLAAREGIELKFFHGRGGSLGRGGGPAARSIRSLPPRTFGGSVRITEQGEVLADRYDDPQIAHRHLEQLIWSSLLASGLPAGEAPGDWRQTMQLLAERSFLAYRQLVEQPGFVEFFRRATPVAEVEQLPIGSRPARRRGGDGLSSLRAIPWVFSWTQARCLIPAWYGLGTAVEASLEDPAALERLRLMYREWPFFRATLDNAELALAKTDLGIAERYARLASDTETLARIGAMVSAEFTRSQRAILTLSENEELLDGTPWLKESIRVRNRYIDPLNLIQVELLRRLYQRKSQADTDPQDELRHLTRLTIKGLASGMRTTG